MNTSTSTFTSFHTRGLVGIAALWMLTQPGLAQAPSTGIADAVRRGLLAEETTRDFKSASEAYAEAVRMSADQRQIQATALYRLAECQRQLGDTNAATTTLQRLAREYPEQRELITKSGAKVPTTGTPGGSRSAAAHSLRDQSMEVELFAHQRRVEIEALKRKKEQLAALEGARFASRVPTEFASAELYRLNSELNTIAVRKASLNPDFGPEHPEMKRMESLLDLVKKQIAEQKAAILEQIDESIERKSDEVQTQNAKLRVLEERLAEESKRVDLMDVTLESPAPAESAKPAKPVESKPNASPGRTVEEVQASIDRMTVQLGVLQNLGSTWEKGRYLASLTGYYSSDVLGGLKTNLSAETDGSSAAEKEQQRKGIEFRFVAPFIRDMNDKLRFAQIELDLLKKQAADREPIQITFFGAMSGVFEFRPSDRMRLSQAVIEIGHNDRVNLKAVTLHRKGARGGQDVITLDVTQLLKSGDPKADIELQKGDRIEFHEKTF